MNAVNKTVWINKFDSVHAKYAYPMEATWDVIKEYFLLEHRSFPNKEDAPLFNLVKYKTHSGKTRADGDNSYVARTQENIEQVDALVVDYDGEISIDNAKDRFKDYEYIGYTSFSHLQYLGIEKFRLIFKLASPIPAWIKTNTSGSAPKKGDYYQVLDALKNFAGPCDTVISNPNQFFFIPTCHPDRIANAQRWHNAGISLDWRNYKRSTKSINFEHIRVSTRKITSEEGGLFLTPDQQIQTSTGLIRVGDVNSRISKVVCPFHDDRNGTEFINRSPAGRVYLYCRHCDQTYYMVENNLGDADKLIQPGKESIKSNIHEKNDNPAIDDGFEYDPVSKFKPADRKRVSKQLSDIRKSILKDRGFTPEGGTKTYKSHILYLPEGAGKSLLAIDFLREGYDVVFACLSWEQVTEKYKDFDRLIKPNEADLKIMWSLDGLIQKHFGLKTIREPPRNYFTPGDLLKEDTIKKICKENPEYSEEYIRLAFEFYGIHTRFEDITYEQQAYDENELQPAAFAQEFVEYLRKENQNKIKKTKSRMIFTTFAQLRLLRVLNDRIQKDWIIWFDDPGITDVLNICPSKRMVENPSTLRARLQLADEENVAVINGTTYELRDDNKELGAAVSNHRCIYTTTESTTMHALKNLLRARRERFVVHNKMEQIADGRITILGTDKVWRCYDALIPLMARRLDKKKHPVVLIGDGLAARYNHSNSKGQNTLNNTNILVEISSPHPEKVKTFVDALRSNISEDGREIAVELMQDQLHQAIGRNSGYRWAGQECVVLVDKSKHRELVQNCRYAFESKNSVIIDKTQEMSHRDTRLTKSASKFVKDIEAFLNGVKQYLVNGNVIKHDINYVVKAIKTDAERFSYIARLLAALTSLSTWRFDQAVDNRPPPNTFASKCSVLGEWILTTHVPLSSRARILRIYSEILGYDEESTSKKGAKRKSAVH